MQQTAECQTVRRVRDVMTTPVHTADLDDSIQTVKLLFEREKCHHVVITKQRRVYGVVSDRDILKVLSPFVGSTTMERPQDLNTLKKRVHQIMSRELVTINPDDTIQTTAEKILQERVSCLPVVDGDGSVVGIVTVRDFVKWSLGQDGPRTEPVEPDHDEGVLVIIDGNRCYSPDAKIARIIRKAENLYDVKHSTRSARAKYLALPEMTGVG